MAKAAVEMTMTAATAERKDVLVNKVRFRSERS
jgi:hypothetical protein